MLSRIYEEHGANWPVIAIIHGSVPVKMVGGIVGIAGKAQLANVRCFVVNELDGRMAEVKWGVDIPYSATLEAVPPKK